MGCGSSSPAADSPAPAKRNHDEVGGDPEPAEVYMDRAERDEAPNSTLALGGGFKVRPPAPGCPP